jgi:hypothetical protein
LTEQLLNLFLRDVLQQLKETEEKRRQTRQAAEARSKLLDHHREAFVENLDRDQLFNAMFENDAVGITLLALGDAAADVYKKYPLSAHDRDSCNYSSFFMFRHFHLVGQVPTKPLHQSVFPNHLLLLHSPTPPNVLPSF